MGLLNSGINTELFFFFLAAPGFLLSTVEYGISSCDMRDLVPWPGIEPRPSALGAWSLSHRTIREVPWTHNFYFEMQDVGKSKIYYTSQLCQLILFHKAKGQLRVVIIKRTYCNALSCRHYKKNITLSGYFNSSFGCRQQISPQSLIQGPRCTENI